MKKFILFFTFLLVIASCNNLAVEKPDNLIEEDKMINVLYDIALLEAIRVSNPVSLETRKINLTTYVFKKYKIDSLQFEQSGRYYSSDVERYAKIYETVTQRLDSNKTLIDSLIKKQAKKAVVKPVKEKTLIQKPKDLSLEIKD